MITFGDCVAQTSLASSDLTANSKFIMLAVFFGMFTLHCISTLSVSHFLHQFSGRKCCEVFLCWIVICLFMFTLLSNISIASSTVRIFVWLLQYHISLNKSNKPHQFNESANQILISSAFYINEAQHKII